MTQSKFGKFSLIFAGIALFGPQSARAAIDFSRQIQPIFAQHCTKCHGDEKPKGGLNLKERESLIGELKSGETAIVPGQPEASELLRRLTTQDADELMPPPDKGKALDASSIALIRQWIAEGAKWSTHWAYRPLGKVEFPSVKNEKWIRNGIDEFVLGRLENKGVAPSPEAPRHTLIRRLSYDLLGLPPTPEEVSAFEKDQSPEAYSKLVDRLLASPHFGERWGRHWLDKARYADSDGYEKDRPRMNAWRYRDWVINSINADLPFDQFTIEQLAGDLLPNATGLQRLATAFNRQTLTNTEGGTDQEQWRVAAVMDRVETLGSVWLGLTVSCARCHNHKYDELSQKEYYQFFAYFNNGDEGNASVPRSRAALLDFEKTQLAHEAKINAARAKIAAYDKVLRQRLPEFEKQLRAKIAEQKNDPVKFHAMKLSSARADVSDKVTFTAQPDGSLLVGGANPDSAEYEVNFHTPLEMITGIRLEVLPDPSLPAKGPGRTPHGNFVLNDVRVYANDKPEFKSDKVKPVKLASATASFAQKDWSGPNAIDGKIGPKTKGTGWAVGPKYGQAHTLEIAFAKPVSFKGGIRLHIVLDQEYGSQHTIGRFRLTARTGQAARNVAPLAVAKALEKPATERNAAEQNFILAHVRTLDKTAAGLQAELKKLEAGSPKPPVMSVRVISQRTNGPRKTHVLNRGEFKQPKEAVLAITPKTLPAVKNRAQGDRLDLARWLVDGKNPLVPRVAVNHMWAYLFGEGLVRTVSDFGVRGEAPTHPALLEWLASEFIQNKWSRKEMIRLIVHSATYRQSSTHRPELIERDPNNLLLHRQNRFRVEAEIIRDINLAASGLLSRKVGGPSVFPPLPSGVANLSYANNFKWNTSKGDDRHRRGLYTFFKRTAPHPNLITFDCPDSNVACVKRTRSNTPLAALVTLNNAVFTEAAKALGKRMFAAAKTDKERLQAGFMLSVSRIPDDREQAALTELLAKARDYYRQNEAAAKEFNGDAEASAWAVTARVMLNLDEFITRE